MDNSIGGMQGSVPPVLLGDATEPQRSHTIPGAHLSSSRRTRSHSALEKLAGIPPRPGTAAAVVAPPIFPLTALPLELQETVATKLDLETARALRQTSKKFKDLGASYFTTAQVPTNLAEIGDMAEFFDKSRNIRALQIQDRANFTNEKLEKLVSMLGDRAPQIKRLDLRGCHLLTDAGLIHLAGLTALQSLNLSNCNGLTALPNLDRLTKLQSLDLSYFFNLTVFPNFGHLTTLQSLSLRGCAGVTIRPILNYLTTLQSLDLSYCHSPTVLTNLDHLTTLQSLNLRGCPGVSDSLLAQLEQRGVNVDR